MNTPVMFGSAGDERATPKSTFEELNREFSFDLDAAASEHNYKCDLYFGPGGIAPDALVEEWGGTGAVVFCNPPYSKADQFVSKARTEADKGAVIVLLLPVRSDTRWWHGLLWDGVLHQPRPGVEVRLLAGRLAFELHVPLDIRTWVKSEMTMVDGLDGQAVKDKITSIASVTGVPPMAIARICRDLPDEQLMESAPFPSCVVICRAAEGSAIPSLNIKRHYRKRINHGNTPGIS